MKRIMLFLATEKGYRTLERMINNGQIDYIAGIVSFHEIGMQHDYFDDIRQACNNSNIRFYEWNEVRSRIPEIIQDGEITSCIAVSWRYILPISYNDYLEDPIIIFHDSLLPKYRGFAPVVTAIINGDEEIGASVLFASEKADCGDIILQRSFKIGESTLIHEAIAMMADLYADMAEELVEMIVDKRLISSQQDERMATYSIWRDEDDYWIDWEQSAEEIDRYIRALGYPYKGAKTCIDNKDIIRIVDSCIVPELKFAIRSPGKIWNLYDGKPMVVCGKGMIRINRAVDDHGNEYKFTKLRTRLGALRRSFENT